MLSYFRNMKVTPYVYKEDPLYKPFSTSIKEVWADSKEGVKSYLQVLKEELKTFSGGGDK